MTARPSFYGTKQRTVLDRTTAMTSLLYGCTDKALAGLTVDTLVTSYGVPVKDAEYALTVARGKRA